MTIKLAFNARYQANYRMIFRFSNGHSECKHGGCKYLEIGMMCLSKIRCNSYWRLVLIIVISVLRGHCLCKCFETLARVDWGIWRVGTKTTGITVLMDPYCLGRRHDLTLTILCHTFSGKVNESESFHCVFAPSSQTLSLQHLKRSCLLPCSQILQLGISCLC